VHAGFIMFEGSKFGLTFDLLLQYLAVSLRAASIINVCQEAKAR